MNLAAMVILAPVFGWFVGNRHHVYVALSAIWLLILPFQTHVVLTVEQAGEPLTNTLLYFFLNYVILAGGIGIAAMVHRRRHKADAPSIRANATVG